MKRRKMIGCICLLIMSMFVNGFARNTDNRIKIGILDLDFSDQFQVYMLDGMKEAAAKYSDQKFEFVYQDANMMPVYRCLKWRL